MNRASQAKKSPQCERGLSTGGVKASVPLAVNQANARRTKWTKRTKTRIWTNRADEDKEWDEEGGRRGSVSRCDAMLSQGGGGAGATLGCNYYW